MMAIMDKIFYLVGTVLCAVGFAWLCLLLFCLLRRIAVILYKNIFGVSMTKGEMRKLINKQVEEIAHLKKDVTDKESMRKEAQNAYISECSKYEDECGTTTALRKCVSRLTEDLEYRDKTIEELKDTVRKLEGEVDYRNSTIAELQTKLADQSFLVQEADKRKKRRKK